MDSLTGYGLYAASLLTMGGIYAILALGLNVQWGFTGLFNAGIAGFFAIGAYVTAILTTGPSGQHLGGYGLPYPVAVLAAMAASAIVAWAVGKVCLRLKSDYLAVATLGVAEIFRLVLRTETWATNGSRGISEIPRPFESLPTPYNQFAFMGLVLVLVAATFLVLQRLWTSPWGRLMTAVRDNPAAARAAGKDVEALRLHGFVLGCAIMALGGALTSHYLKFIDPNVVDPFLATFLVWVMLIIGGSANNVGAVVGAFLIWAVWSLTEILTTRLPEDFAARAAYLRVFLVGLALQFFLQRHPEGLFPEKKR